MARFPKKEEQKVVAAEAAQAKVEDWEEAVEAVAAAPAASPEMVRVLSMREGAIVLKGGVTIKKNDVLEVSKDIADWLVKSFPGEMKIV